MKHIVTVISFLLCINSGEVSAQLIRQYGLKGGLTSADQTFDWSQIPDPATMRRVRFNITAYVEWFDLPMFSLLTQLEYTQRGFGHDLFIGRFGPSGFQIDRMTLYSRLDYLSIPIFSRAVTAHMFFSTVNRDGLEKES